MSSPVFPYTAARMGRLHGQFLVNLWEFHALTSLYPLVAKHAEGVGESFWVVCTSEEDVRAVSISLAAIRSAMTCYINLNAGKQ